MLRDLATMKPSKSSIGSGVVEAGWRKLVTQRQKHSGTRWRHVGGKAILTLRALVQSECFARSRQIANLDVKKVG